MSIVQYTQFSKFFKCHLLKETENHLVPLFSWKKWVGESYKELYFFKDPDPLAECTDPQVTPLIVLPSSH